MQQLTLTVLNKLLVMKKDKIKTYLLAYVPILLILLIQFFDKENNYRFVQYIIFGLMIISLMYIKLIKR